jgi:phage N-6-adenine-methyltransferase
MNDGWRTPPALFAWVEENIIGGAFAADAAATKANTLCKVFFADGLAADWSAAGGPVWCNPPYSNKVAWTAKAAAENRRGCASVLLVPGPHRYERWWEANVVGQAEAVILIGQRLRFGDAVTGAPAASTSPWGSCLIVFAGQLPERATQLLSVRF